MNVEIEELVKEVRIALDENVEWNGVLLDDSASLTLDEIIRQKIVHATRMLIDETPAADIGNGRDFREAPVVWHGKAGRILLPDDFLRLIAFRMSDWAMAVRDMGRDDTEEYVMQSSPVPGIGADAQHPAVFRTRIQGDDILEFFGSVPSAEVIEAEYMPEPYAVDGIIDIPEKLKTDIIYRAAGLTAMAVKDDTLSQNLIAVSNRRGNTGKEGTDA